ncbi:alpha/beta fold hydrolase [Streptomyces sp. ME18-1-4]|uniref:alpha/beta fold hydrolase n=1 Tax=Streptomyces sp. ME18-1-4 TaxID=3028685 RepID=UPI0039F649BE
MVLLGASWGATPAAEYLAAHPDRVARMVLTSRPGPRATSGTGSPPAGGAGSTSWRRAPGRPPGPC